MNVQPLKEGDVSIVNADILCREEQAVIRSDTYFEIEIHVQLY